MTIERPEVSRRGLIGLAGAGMAIAATPARILAAGPLPARLFLTDAGKGRNVMLLHGWTADSHDWSWQLPILEARYRVIALDLRGHGRSEVMPSGRYRPDDYVADIETLISTGYPGETFTLIGHSMGGQIAARLAARRPDLVDAVVSVDAPLGFADASKPIFAMAVRELQVADPGRAASLLFDKFYDPLTPSAYRRWHARRALGMPATVVRESLEPLFFGPGQVGVGEASERFCRGVSQPFYHLCRDQAQAERMREWFPHPKSKVERWADAGHWIMEDRPDDVNAALVSWIDRL